MAPRQPGRLGGGVSPSVRIARPADYDAIVDVVNDWWGRDMARDLSRLFLDHFFATSLIAEDDSGGLAGFLVGFHSPSDPALAYVHFVGVAPQARRSGLARDLYDRFFAGARAAGRTAVKAVTSPVNATSIRFHRALGFAATEPAPGYDGPGQDRVVFSMKL